MVFLWTKKPLRWNCTILLLINFWNCLFQFQVFRATLCMLSESKMINNNYSIINFCPQSIKGHFWWDLIDFLGNWEWNWTLIKIAEQQTPVPTSRNSFVWELFEPVKCWKSIWWFFSFGFVWQEFFDDCRCFWFDAVESNAANYDGF